MRSFEAKAIERAMLLFVCAAIVWILFGQGRLALPEGIQQVTTLSDGWYYWKDGQRVDVTLPAQISQTEGEELTLYYDGLTQDSAGELLTTRGAIYGLKIAMGEEELYQYEDSSFPRNNQMASKVNCTVQMPKDFTGGTVSLTYQNTGSGLYRIGEVCTGSGLAVFFHQCEKDAFTLITVFVMAILGFMTICISFYLKYMGVREKRFADIACFLLFCVCWFITDSSLAQSFSGDSPILRYISFYAFMLLAVPMLHFVKDTENMQEYTVIDGIIYLFYGNVVVQSLLHYFAGINFVDMLFVTHLLLIGGIVALVVVLIREYRKAKSKELHIILNSFVVVASGGTVALILYWLLRISYYEVFFECGIVVMIILLIRSLIVSMVQNLRFRTEAMVYQQLANEDMLTGMKNRRAFDALIWEIQGNAGAYKNTFLVFMDMNKLKEINDHLGHHMGDEAIIAAAGAIRKAFGEDGQCFRIGGDEFCAVVMNCEAKEEDLARRLDAEIRQYNRTCSKYQISVACGISSLWDEHGQVKTVSDWKREADMKMYADKGWVRRDAGKEERI